MGYSQLNGYMKLHLLIHLEYPDVTLITSVAHEEDIGVIKTQSKGKKLLH